MDTKHELLAAQPATQCPCCGAYTGTVLATSPALLAVCDVLLVRALEVVGKKIVRLERTRYSQLGNRPWYLAHTLWQPDEGHISKTLDTAWETLPAFLSNHGIGGVSIPQLTSMLDRYTRDLLTSKTPHKISYLKTRLEKLLGIPLPEIQGFAPSRPAPAAHPSKVK